jgi:O-antigen/teichoic acid export membrane protein
MLSRYSTFIRNVSWLGSASLAMKPLWFLFITLLCARLLGAGGYGVLNTALSLGSLTFALASFGLKQYTVREVAADRTRASSFLSNFLLLRMALVVVAAVAALGTALALDYDMPLLAAVGITCLYQGCLSLTDYARSFFQAFEVLKYQAISVVAEKVLVVAGGTLFLYATLQPMWTLAGMAAGMALTAVGTLLFVLRRFAPFRTTLVQPAFWRESFQTLWPFGVASLLGMAFFRIDTVMVEAMGGVVMAGQYGLPFRLVEALNMLPAILVSAATYPRLASLLGSGDRAAARRLVRVVAGVLAAVSLPVALGVALLASPLIEWIAADPALHAGAPALQVLCWAFPLSSLRSLLYFTLSAADQQRFLVGVLTVGVAMNVGLNLYLIPTLGIVGAATATIASEIFLLCIYGVRYGQWLRKPNL